MSTNHTMRIRVFLIRFMSLIPAGIAHAGAAGISGESTGTTLIALSMVGSDLESEYNLGTREIDEICSGLEGSQGAVDLVIAYGGAKKKGWSGFPGNHSGSPGTTRIMVGVGHRRYRFFRR